MTAAALALPPTLPTRLFLGVERSVCGRAWRDRLDERGDGARARDRAAPRRAGAAGAHPRRARRRGRRGRGIPRSDRAAADAGSGHADRHGEGGGAHRRRDRARRAGRDLRRLRRRRRDLGGAAGALPAPWRPRAARSTSRTASSRATARTSRRSARLPRSGATLLVTVDCGTTSIEPLAEAQAARPRRRRDRPSSGRRGAAAGRCAGQSEPAGRSLGARPSRRRRPGVHGRGRGQPRAAQARLLDTCCGRSRTCSTRSISSRSAPSPTWCR